MFYTTALATIAIAFIGTSVQATPAPPTPPTSFPIATLDISAISNITRVAGGPHSDATLSPQIAAYLYLYEGSNCSGTYSYTNLGGMQANECTQNNPFVSVIIQQIAPSPTPYEVVVGPRQCPEVIALPSVGVCYNLSGALFEAYAVITAN
ncbi:hypothetical protein ONZ51_g2603 [Trametes cubensis]|uniref:Uncharacterized protein n=1 Tax=Trametes cubensis TaxID=1111947 RepID=A0AAD7XEC9_9APHY|nr:hypothetical protein ONZ51_g2603 [Trametes cubensis]